MLGAKALARAKINLYLEVGRRRDDGYHDIRSVMQSLELSDELYFRRTSGRTGRIVIRSNDTKLPTGEDNLAWRAIEVFEESAGVRQEGGIEVLINKRIPVGAGLAGGSADAAAALMAMNHIHELDMPLESIAEMAALVGSDVPFCVMGGTALASGRGERVQQLDPLPPCQVVLASTGEEASTAEVYRRFDDLAEGHGATVEGPPGTLDALLDGIRNHDYESVYANLHNSLESATIATDRVEHFKGVARAAGAPAALMTGSGPTVFALVSGMEQAAEVAWELEKAAPVTIVTSFASRGAEISAV